MDGIEAVSVQGGVSAPPKRRASGESFIETLKAFTRQVDEELRQADRKMEAFAAGAGVDLHDVMIATEKADLSFRLMLQMRNKLLEAYQEIMRIQV